MSKNEHGARYEAERYRDLANHLYEADRIVEELDIWLIGVDFAGLSRHFREKAGALLEDVER